MATFDYIIVGAGAAGCVLANRLSEDPQVRVLVMEFGGRDKNPLLFIPKGFYFTLQGDRYCYHYQTQPVGPAAGVESWTRGKVSGGSTSINGMMYIRGARADYDGMAERGNSGWGWRTTSSELLRSAVQAGPSACQSASKTNRCATQSWGQLRTLGCGV
jgi:choline dehydrogenase